MRVMEINGNCYCHFCRQPLQLDPRVEERARMQRYQERRLEQLRAIEDDDEAARKFHLYKRFYDHQNALQEHWIDQSSLSDPNWGDIECMGFQINVSPTVSVDAIMKSIDCQFLPMLRRQILRTVDGRGSLAAELASDEAWGDRNEQILTLNPSAPRPISELYPHGYVRHTDGTVEARDPPATTSGRDDRTGAVDRAARAGV